MGDFPAYDILSGVPLPKPYTHFEPAKALPRPYRPFRWAYHQTMCKQYLIEIFGGVFLMFCSFDQDGARLVARSGKHLRLPSQRA
jgi:hypothetical protein